MDLPQQRERAAFAANVVDPFALCSALKAAACTVIYDDDVVRLIVLQLAIASTQPYEFLHAKRENSVPATLLAVS